MERDYTPHQMFHQWQQNRLHSVPPTVIGVEDSQFRHHGISARNHDFHHISNDHHIYVVPYGPHYNARPVSDLDLGGADFSNFYNHCLIPSSNIMSHYYAPQGNVSSMAVHNRNLHGGSLETRDTGRIQYSEFDEMYGSLDSHVHHSYTNNYELDLHQPLPPMQAMRGNNLNPQPQVPSSSSYMHQMNNPQHRNTSHSSWGSIDDFRPLTNQDNLRPEDSLFGHLTVQLVDDVILLEGFVNLNVSNIWLDDEDMSYEELLDLQEQMSHINTGLSEGIILRNLKMRTHISPSKQLNLNEAPCLDQEPEICVICQGEYENYDLIGSLECRHDYHAACINKWLQEKNVCPVCKATALTIKS